MKEISVYAELASVVGERIRVSGVAQNTKATPRLLLDGSKSVDCDGPHWGSGLIGKRVVVEGTLYETSEPNFPVATQDENGAWSQGVVVPQILVPSDDPLNGPMFVAEPLYDFTRLVLSVEDVRAVD